jgi:hypothetical protein
MDFREIVREDGSCVGLAAYRISCPVAVFNPLILLPESYIELCIGYTALNNAVRETIIIR